VVDGTHRSRKMEPLSQVTLDPALFTSTLNNNWIGIGDSPVMARHSHLNNLSPSSHARHQSVPVIPSPQQRQGGDYERQCSRGLAKLTLVERLSQESVPSPENTYAGSPRSLSPVRFDDASSRPTHSPRKNRMSLSIPATKTASVSVIAGPSPITSPLQSTPVAPTAPINPSKHVSKGSFSDINLSPSPLYAHERAITSPTLSTLEELPALDDAHATFLTLIAFQERRVVELREELARAESELDFLKQQWTRQQLNLTGRARQEHVRQNSLTKLEHQLAAGGTPRNLEDGIGQFKSPQILAAGRKLAEGVRDGLFGMMEDLKGVAASESVQATTMHRGRSLTKGQPREEDPPVWYPKPRSSSPMKRNVSRESEDSNITTDTTSIGSS